jgi:hypothetical protein
MFEQIMEYPLPIAFEGGLVVCVDVTITLELEPVPDGGRDWDIVGMTIYGNKMHAGFVDPGKPKDYTIPVRDPMFCAIRNYAIKHWSTPINDKWDKWVSSRAERIADARRA